jgi:hypothetical protein
MLRRNLEQTIRKYAREYPVIALVGPRQSGKTTLARLVFKDHEYLSLENLDLRHQAEEDPRGFLEDHGGRVIIDEAQRAPGLFSYLQEMVDRNDAPGQYVLTGSQQFLLMEKITQSLAGRIATFRLYPFTVNELFTGRRDDGIDSIFTPKKDLLRHGKKLDARRIIFTGMYPRIHDRKLDPGKWLENYVMTYVERDIRSLVNIENLKLFELFLKTTASYSGQMLNYAAISNSTGVSQPTAKKWLSLLETSGIVFMLPPHLKNFRKRLVKTPKLYFIDTGLLCFLLSIRTPAELAGHPLFGNIFETFIIGELYKRICHTGGTPPLYFWRDRTGNEIDLLVDFGRTLLPIEIKSSKTYNTDFAAGIKKYIDMSGKSAKGGYILYSGDGIVGSGSPVPAVPWWMM